MQLPLTRTKAEYIAVSSYKKGRLKLYIYGLPKYIFSYEKEGSLLSTTKKRI